MADSKGEVLARGARANRSMNVRFGVLAYSMSDARFRPRWITTSRSRNKSRRLDRRRARCVNLAAKAAADCCFC
jgi:hypothetical protein